MAANLGYCGVDRLRAPLVGDEIRACWEAGAPLPVDDTLPRIPVFEPEGGPESRPRLEFVELEVMAPVTKDASPPADPGAPIEPLAPVEARWSLWGDLDR